MRVKPFLLLILFLILLFCLMITGCEKKENPITSDYFLLQDSFSIQGDDGKTTEKLPIALSKIKQALGSQIEPVTFRMLNLDSEISHELLFFYRDSKESDVKFVIFDILPNEVLKKVYEMQTSIRRLEDFSLQYNSLLYEDDNCIIIEGIGEEDRRYLYIIKNVNNGKEFQLIGSFSATYSVFFNMAEKEDENGEKYYILKEIVLIDSALSLTNTNIQRKDVYVWDYSKERFVLAESSQIISKGVTDIPLSVLYSAENYFNYLKGFWYHEKYEKVINTGEVAAEDFNESEIQYVNFIENHGEREVNVNYGNYSDNFLIDKMIKLGGQKPGLRLSIQKDSFSDMFYYRYIDVYLMEGKVLKLKTPEVFEAVTYVRLPKPFIEYVEEAKESEAEKMSQKIEDVLKGDFVCNDFKITIDEKRHFFVTGNGKRESGYYKLEQRDENRIVSLSFQSENTILGEKYFFLDDTNADRIILLPIRLEFQGITVKNVKPMVWIREGKNEGRM